MKKIFSFLKKQLFYILLLIFSVMIPFSLGMGPAFYGILASFLIFLILRHISYVLFSIVFLFVLTTCVLFLPQIIWFGHPPTTMVGAFFETDFQESKEFAQSLPLYSYLISVACLGFGILVLFLGNKSNRIRTNWVLWILGVIALLLTIYKPYKHYLKGEDFQWNYSRTAIISFYVSVYKNIQEYRYHKAKLENEIQLPDTWEITQVTPKYKNYVLVVGESVWRDYMSLYGFELENSKFLKNVDGKILEGFTAAAPNTIPSLLRTFVQQNADDFLYANHIITLANKAGFETIWLSNQGYAGDHDSSISKIAIQSKKHLFSKKAYYNSMNYYDSVLIPIFEKYLNESTSQPRLFVLHLAGSHQAFSQRLENPIHYDFVNTNMSAYLQTIEQTDSFLEAIYQLLKQQSEPFSMLYFADHGLMTQDRNVPFFTTLTHGDSNPKQSCYKVPFALISSDDTSHQHLKINKSAYYFLDGFANWLGIQEKTLNADYQFFSETPDTLKVFNHFEKVWFDSIEKDSIILPKK